MKKPVCLIIRDGWGKGLEEEGNAIFSGNTKYTDAYEKEYPTMLIKTSGISAGLPAGYQGNSEVGHLNIGAGRIVYQSLTRIDKAIDDGDFFENIAILKAIRTALQNNSTLHLMGLIQSEGVHSVTRHCISILERCKKEGLEKVVIHALTDGRDTPPRSTLEHLGFLQDGIDRVGVGRIVSLIGRYYAMDRDTRWDRTELAYRAIMCGEGKKCTSWQEAVKDAYANDENDEFIKPRLLDYEGIGVDDTIVFFNFRFDRTRQLTKAIVESDFSEFETIEHGVKLTAMTHYYDNGNFSEAFPELKIKDNLGETLSKNGLKQLRSAETEKYAHVTFFFNSLRNDPYENEERILVKSPNVATYDLQPEMSANVVRDKLVEAVKSDKYDVIICNFANGDMVGHTGIYEAILKAVETVDICVNDVVQSVLAKNGVCIICADHGNAEKTRLEDGSPMTAHTTNPVPLTIIGLENAKLRDSGKLCDIAPTILSLLGIDQPAAMDGQSLLLHPQ